MALVVLFLLLLGGVAAIGFTETGTAWLVRQLQPLLPGELEYRQLRGRLFGRLELEGVSYRQLQLSAQLGRAEFAWTPAALLQGRLQLDALGVESLDLQLPPGSDVPQEPSEPFQLPESIPLPLQLRVESVYGRQLRIQPAGAQPVLIDSFDLALHTEDRKLVLDRLDVSAPQGGARLNGDIDAGDDYPLAFSLDWQLKLPESGEVSGRGVLQGDLRSELTLTQQVRGLADLDLEARISQPLDVPNWQLALTLARFDPAPFAPQLAGQVVAGRIDLSGDLESATGTLALDGSVPEAGTVELRAALDAGLDRVRLADTLIRLPDSGAEIRLEGLVSALQGTPELDLKLDWRGLRYPLPKGLPQQYASERGQVRLTGPLNDYRLEVAAELAGEQVPAAKLNLQGQGSLEGFNELALRLETLGGQLAVDGSAGWAPQPAWRLRATAENIDPGRHWADWPGALGFALATEGGLEAGVPSLQATIESLSGQLRGQPLSGRGRVRLQGADLAIETLHLGWGNAGIDASGKAGETLALDWRLVAEDLAALLPDAGGRLSASGTLSGPRAAPALAADISAEALAFQANRLEQLSGTLALDLGWKSPARVELQAQRLSAGGQSIDSLSLTGGGAQQNHSLTLALDSQVAKLDMRLEGGLFGQQWRGRLMQLELQQPLAGDWALQAPAELNLGADRAGSETLCLEAQGADGRLCVDGLWQAAGDSAGNVRLERLPLALLSPWIPPGTELEGFVNADASARLGAAGALQYQARLTLDETRLSLPEQDLAFDLNEARVEAAGSRNNANARLVLAMDDVDGRLDATVSLADLQGAGSLDGRLQMAMEDLAFVSALVPAIRVGSGRLDGDIRLGGSLQQPRINGALALDDGHVEVPAAGIALELLQLELRDDPARADRMLLSGSAVSGGGNLSLSGELQPLTSTGRIAIQGDRFQAVGTPEIEVFVSPDMRIEIAQQRIAVGGELVVPEALIKPPKLSVSAVSVSSDAVIVDAEGRAEATRPGPALDLDLRVTMGEKVWVDAFGFNGRLTGSMVLREDERRVTRATGNIGVATGEYQLYGQDLNIERGSFVYTGGPVDNPGLNLRVQREVEDVEVGAQVAGSLRAPTFELFSDPVMPDNARLSYLVFGRAPGAASEGEQAMLMKLALALGRSGGDAIGEKVSGALNVDEISLGGGDTLQETSLYIGKYLSPRLYIKYGVGLAEPTNEFIMRYLLTKQLSFESNTGTEGSGADLFYSFER
ncbi:translocation/assembly module TamB domain-containing protein [Marinobacterium nitratireducens]|uniref:translocation/assembly module TamB domain-containing protein n=1 Tax=Marinobacterium nitratireducens TaxID=518897 RepID=UPI00166B063F|nr:translocation/assembly module TamB domain-containing protein [Marinobacterium nitratireducens]